MAFSRNVDVLPPDYDQEKAGREDAKRIQSLRWKVLVGTFLVFLSASLAWVWSRPELFQSQSIIHFTYPEEFGQELSTVPREQIQLNQQRLTSFRVLETLSQNLIDNHSLSLSPEALGSIISTDPDFDSRVINLYATDQNATILEPVLSTWVELYLASLELETESRKDDNIQDTQDKIAVLEGKIRDQRLQIEAFAEEHNIVSLERDENRTLNKIKGLSGSLDKADADLALATAEHKKAVEAAEKGQGKIHPSDEPAIRTSRSNIRKLNNELDALAEKYTPEYMALDPAVVAKKRNLEKLTGQLETRIERSKARYLQSTEQRMETLRENGNQLNAQLITLTEQAQAFNKRLREYDRLNNILKQLQKQTQGLRDRLVKTEVDQPFRPKINVLENPFVPVYPIGPDYWIDTAIATGASAGGALLCLLIFSFIVRPQQPQTSVTSYTVVPNSGPALGQASDPAIALQQQQQLGHQAPVAQLQDNSGQSQVTTTSRTMTAQECQALYDNSNRQTRLVQLLAMSGVDLHELLSLRVNDIIDGPTPSVNVSGRFARKIALPEGAAAILEANAGLESDTDAPLLHGISSVEGVDQLLINAAHDARLNFPEEVSFKALRHTHITHLVSLGVKLNDLESLVGFIAPEDVGRYRQVSRPDTQVDVQAFNATYPLDW